MIIEINYLTVMLIAAVLSALGGVLWAMGRSLLQQYGNMLRDQLAAHRADSHARQTDITDRLDKIEHTLADHATRLGRVDADLARVPTDEDLEKIYARINTTANDLAEVKGSLRGIDQTLRTLMSRITERGLQ